MSKDQIHPMNVITNKGYAKNGRGDDVGNTRFPQKILAAVMQKRTEVATPTSRTPSANSLGILMSNRAVVHNAVPAPKEETLP